MSYLIVIAVFTIVIIIIGMSLPTVHKSCSSGDQPDCKECSLGEFCAEHGEKSKSGRHRLSARVYNKQNNKESGEI